MTIVTIDFETYYSQDYSLTRLSEIDYIFDPRFQVIMCSVKVDQNPTEVFVGEAAVRRKFSSIDWSHTAALAHNMRFDGAILAWHFGITPALYLDTLSMARATTHWVLGRSSLAKVAEYLELPPKGDEVVRAQGKRLEDFTTDELRSYADYCVHDTDLCKSIFDRLRPLIPNSELSLIDIILRMYTHPQVKLNANVLAEHLHHVRAEKACIMGQVAHVDPSVFSSNQKFAALLESNGVDVPRKISPTTGLETYALARNDRAFKELLMDESQPLQVQALLAARVNTKSTIEETRTEKLLHNAMIRWPSGETGWAAVPLKYYAARSGRLGGDSGENWQNFKRGSRIREAVEAPVGYRIVHRDASQIEARMVAWLAKCAKLLSAFADGRDVYSEFASTVYRRTIARADKRERFVGKTGILGLGYGCGHLKFRHMLFLGNGGLNETVSEDEARRIVQHYRSEYPEIQALWTASQGLVLDIVLQSRSIIHTKAKSILQLYPGVDASPHTNLGILRTGFDAIWLPNGMCISYPNVRMERNSENLYEIIYDGPYGTNDRRKIYGGKATENISQTLARIVITDIAVRVYHQTKRRPFLSTHDSLDYCVPESEAEEVDALLDAEFARRPSWAPDLPLASEGGWGRTLAAAERMDNE